MQKNKDLYWKLYEANREKEAYIHEYGYSISDDINDPVLDNLKMKEQELLYEIRKSQIIEFVENSYLFASDNEYWVQQMEEILEKERDAVPRI